MKTLIMGLGNPILGDDGVGWRVAEAVAKLLPIDSNIQIECCAVGGLSLMERMTGYENVILIDSISTGSKPVGTVYQFSFSQIENIASGHIASAHDASLQNAINVGRSMEIPLPGDESIKILAIEAKEVFDFSENLSAPVERAIPLATTLIMEIIESTNQEGKRK